MLNPGHLFVGRYRVVRFLARGGMGEVYEGAHVQTEQRVAIKTLLASAARSQSNLRSFELEARVAARIGSENVVQVFDAGQDPETGMLYLVMELLQGATLEALVASRGALSAQEVGNYVTQVASALDRAHMNVAPDGSRAPIVHRDLKPDNVFVCHRADGSPLVKILDFGIAKVLAADVHMSREVKGTPLYISPEQLEAGDVSPQTDIWALGLITFYLLTARSFWRSASAEGGSITTLLVEILAPRAPSASQRMQQLGLRPLPAAFDEWLARCVAQRPADRFPSAGYAASALRAALAGRGDVSSGHFAVPGASPAQIVAFVPAAQGGLLHSAAGVSLAPAPPRQSGGAGRAIVAGGVVLAAISLGAAGTLALLRAPRPEPASVVPAEAPHASASMVLPAAPSASVSASAPAPSATVATNDRRAPARTGAHDRGVDHAALPTHAAPIASAIAAPPVVAAPAVAPAAPPTAAPPAAAPPAAEQPPAKPATPAGVYEER